jgi:ribose transport system substrate-binding protein
MSHKRSAKLVALLVVALVLLASAFVVIGCGSSSSSSSTSPAASASSGGAQTTNQAAAAAAYAGMTAVPTFVAPPGGAFDAKKVMAGKSILSIPGTGTDPFYVQMENGMKQAAAAVGYPFTTWNNQGQLTQYQQGFQNAITKKTSLIDLLAGPDPNSLKPQIDEAQKAGIKVVSSHLTAFEQTVPYVNYNLPQDYTKAGRTLADWIIAHDYGAHVLLIGSDEIVSTSASHNGYDAEMAKYGPNIQTKYFNVTVPEWGTKIQPQVQSAIVADPKLTYVACIYDSMTQFVVPGVTAANATGKVHIIGFNATPFVIDLVRTGKVDMTFGDSLNWAGWAIADAEMRILAGQNIPKNGAVGQYLNNPFRMFTKDNAAEAGVPAKFSEGFGSYQPAYLKLWGLK